MKFGGHWARKMSIEQLYKITNDNSPYDNNYESYVCPTKEAALNEINRRKRALERASNYYK